MQIPDDDVVARFLALRPLRFDELECFELSYSLPPTPDRSMSALTIVLRPSPHIAAPKLVITCTGIAQLQLEAGSYMQLVQLEVRSIAEWQWEHLHFFVHDVENEKLSFYCDTFEAAIVDESADDD